MNFNEKKDEPMQMHDSSVPSNDQPFVILSRDEMQVD
jgi:hypothetical protein